MKQDMFPLMLLLGLVTGAIAMPFVEYFNVFDYGASGLGEIDDSHAFVNAWRDACDEEMQNAGVIVPEGTFLLNPLMFSGPCKSQSIHFKVLGTIIAPSSPESWNGRDSSQWIVFKGIICLNVYGSGLINGKGMRWWEQSCRRHPEQENCTKLAPTSFKFISCKESTLSDISLVNSPQTHVLILTSKGFNVENVKIQSPENSPNTDGIHIHSSHFVKITNSIIGTGDDCISIGDYTSNIDISNIECGPGHGISIGSLGKDGKVVIVENINIYDSTLKGTTNGARIKTWQGGQGNIQNITFENLIFDAVNNPIIIDQNYCDVRGMCDEKDNGVKISNVVYKNLYGASSSKIAINLNCSKMVHCSEITMENITLVSTHPGELVIASCTNAEGTEVEVNPGSCFMN